MPMINNHKVAITAQISRVDNFSIIDRSDFLAFSYLDVNALRGGGGFELTYYMLTETVDERTLDWRSNKPFWAGNPSSSIGCSLAPFTLGMDWVEGP